jgi:hypothetical protein
LLAAGSSIRGAVGLALIGAIVTGCGQQPTPPPTDLSMTTITIPAPGQDEAILERAEQVMAARLRALGITNFTATAGDDMTFMVAIPAAVDVADVEAVLNTRGDVQWLAWSDEPWPSEGDPVREGVPPLFGSADIASGAVQPAGVGSPGGVLVRLDPAAHGALETYTRAHVAEPALPVAMDGTILLSPIINSPIESGELLIGFADDGPISPEALVAILASGPLPAEWAGN